MGLAEQKLWSLSPREFIALDKHRLESISLLQAPIRADLHNTSARDFKRTFKPADFLPDSKDESLEARAKQLIAQGYSPSQAVAIASSKQTKDRQVVMIDSVLRKKMA